MTSKQFMQILEYFFKGITGRDMQALVGKGDLYDGIIRVLKSLDCPFMINKSMLRTPNTPHTFDQMIVLLLWLGDFICLNIGTDATNAPSEYKKDAELPSLAYTEAFSKAAMDGFQLWNKESDEFLVLQDHLVDSYISETFGGGIETAKQVVEMSDRLKANSIELRAIPTVIPGQQAVEELESKFLATDEKLHSMTTKRDEMTHQLEGTKKQWEMAQQKLNAKQMECRALKESIKRQAHSVVEYNQLGQAIAVEAASVNVAKKVLEDMKATESMNAINRARLLHQLTAVLPEVTKKLDYIITCIKSSQLRIDTNALNRLSIEPQIATLKLSQLERINGMLKHIDNDVHSYLDELRLNDERATVKMSTMRKEKQFLAEQIEAAEKKQRKCVSDIEIIDGVLKMNETKLANFIEQLKVAEKTYQFECDQKEEDITTSCREIIRMEGVVREAMADGERQVMARVQERRERIAKIARMNDFLDGAIDDIRGQPHEDDDGASGGVV